MPLLRGIDPETAHRLAVRALRAGLAGHVAPPPPSLKTAAFGQAFASPIGIAAGFDKNAEAVAALRRIGFAFVEVGTVTLHPQAGNPRPRVFRLTSDRAIINRLGFNSAGADTVEARIRALPPEAHPFGVNLGLNRSGADPLTDYAALAARFAPFADYLTINVSSPNTPGLRDLQAEQRLAALLASLPAERPPLFVKIAPDLTGPALEAIVDTCIVAGVAGLIISNTTIDRPPGLGSPHADEQGGLSGTPLFARATAMLARAYLLAGGRLTLIGVGGVSTGDQVLQKLKAGATLVQIYTAFAYDGPALLPRLHAQLAAALKRDGFTSPAEAIGTEAQGWIAATRSL